MVLRTWDGNRLFRRALIASLALHMLLALFLPAWTAQLSQGLQPVETVSFARLTHVLLQRPAAKSLPAAVLRTTHRAPRISFARVKSELTAHTRKPNVRPRAQNGPVGRKAAAPKLLEAHQAPLYARAAVTATVSSIQASPAPSPQPLASQADVATAGSGASDRGGVLPFGATQDPVLDPSVRSELAKRFGVHVTLIVTVGEDGHTKRVIFQPPVDAQTEAAIRALLADANWDAAVCGGGVSCQGTATIKF